MPPIDAMSINQPSPPKPIPRKPRALSAAPLVLAKTSEQRTSGIKTAKSDKDQQDTKEGPVTLPGKRTQFNSSRLSHRISSGVSSMASAGNEVRVSESNLGPINGNVGNGWHRTYARAIVMGKTPRSFAMAFTRSRR